MATYYVRTGASGSNNGTTWANAYTTLYGALSGKAAGDVFYVAADYNETNAGAMTFAVPGYRNTVTNCKIICVDHLGAVPPTAADIRDTAQITTTIGDIGIYGGHWVGFIFRAAGSIITNTAGLDYVTERFDNCSFRLTSTSGTNSIGLGNLSWSYVSNIELNNVTMSFAAVGQYIQCAGRVRWFNTANAILGTAVPTVLFAAFPVNPPDVVVMGVDLSAVGSGKTLVGSNSNYMGRIRFVDCKLHASVTKSQALSSMGAVESDFIRSGASGNYMVARHRFMGTMTEETTIYRDGGATDGTTPISWKMVTNANACWDYPLDTPLIASWNDTLGGNGVAVIVECLWNASVAPNDDEVWVELDYLGDASSPQGTFASDTKSTILSAGTAQEDSTEDWIGIGGGWKAFRLKVHGAMPQQKGFVNVRVLCGRASTTIYVDPKVSLTPVVPTQVEGVGVAAGVGGGFTNPLYVLGGLVGWWDTSVSSSLNLTGSEVNSINDISGQGSHLTWVSAKPTYSATGFNSRPAVTVASGTASALQKTGFPMGTGNTITVFLVGPIAQGGNNYGRYMSYLASGQANDYNNIPSWDLNRRLDSTSISFDRNSVSPIWTATAYPAAHRFILTMTSAGEATMYIDGVAQTPSTSGGNWTTGGTFAVGRNATGAGEYISTSYAEWGISTNYADANLVRAIDNYLGVKWGLLSVGSATGTGAASAVGSGGSAGVVEYGSQGAYLAWGARMSSTVAAPAGIAADDLLLAYMVFVRSDDLFTLTPPTGWSHIPGSPSAVSAGGLYARHSVFYKIASASEPANYTFDHSSNTANTCGVVIRYTGVDTANPFSPTPTKNTGTGSTATATGFTTTEPNTFVIFTEQDWGDDTVNCTPPFGTERVDDVILYVSDGTFASAGATGNQSHTCNSAGSNPWNAWLIGLKAATAGVAYGSQGTYLAYGNRSTTTLDAPSDIAAGDFLIAYLAAGRGAPAAAITPPSGWTQLSVSPITVFDGVSFYVRYAVYYKVATGSEPSDYAFTNDAANTCGVIIRYTGVDTTNPFSPTPTANTGTGLTATATGFTTTQPNSFVIFTEQDWGGNTTNCDPPFGTERVDDVILYVSDGTIASAGATGNISHTCNSEGTNPWAAYLIGLKAAT